MSDEISKIKFENGVTLITEHYENTRKAALLIGVKVGSVDENDKLSGASHFNEHLLFKSNRYRSARKIIEDLEYSGIVVNAYTTCRYTGFYAKTPSDELENTIEILFQAATNFNYLQSEFELERKVILTEIQNISNSPERYSLTRLFIPTLFEKTPLDREIGGTRDSISSMEKEELEEFKKRYYKIPAVL